MFSRDVRLYIIATAILAFTIINGIYPMLFNLYLLRLGYGPEFIGLVNSAGMFSTAIFAMPASALAFKFGTRRSIIFGTSLATACSALLPLLAFLPAGTQEPTTIICRILGDFGFTLFAVNSIPFLSNASRPEERGHVFSVRQSMWPLFGFIGSLAGGVLPALTARLLSTTVDSAAAYRWPLVLSALLCLPAITALIMTDKHETADEQESRQESNGSDAMPWALIGAAAVVGLLRSASVGVARTFFNVYLDDFLGLPTTTVGTLYATAQLLSTPAPLLTPFLIDRIGAKHTVVVATLGVALSTLPLALIPNPITATGGRLFMAGLSSMSFAAMSVFQMGLVKPRWRSVIAGANTMARGLSWALLSLGGGYLITFTGYRELFLLGALLSAAGATFFGLFFAKDRGEYANEPA